MGSIVNLFLSLSSYLLQPDELNLLTSMRIATRSQNWNFSGPVLLKSTGS